MNQKLAEVARIEATKFFHGDIMGVPSNLQPIAELFPTSPTWKLENWNNCWCSAFVYYCTVKAGLGLPVRYQHPKVSCNFGGCVAWEEWAKLEDVSLWKDKNKEGFGFEEGDIILFDNVFLNQEHDHIGIILEVHDDELVIAEGNFNNVSAIISRPINSHIRGCIRIEEKF